MYVTVIIGSLISYGLGGPPSDYCSPLSFHYDLKHTKGRTECVNTHTINKFRTGRPQGEVGLIQRNVVTPVLALYDGVTRTE